MKASEAFSGKPSISRIGLTLDVSDILAQLDAHPEAWNRHRPRTETYGTPHSGVSDIWVRYNDWSNFKGDLAAFNGPHVPVWYPVIKDIPAARLLCLELLEHLGGGRLGGVLITRIPPGGEVAPHIDRGWHADHYQKYAIQVKGNKEQTFWFEDAQLHPETGDVYTFDNSRTHAVWNPSHEERITLIVCIRRPS